MTVAGPLEQLIAMGGVAGVTKVQMRGRNAAISNTAETVWQPGATYAKLTAGAAMEAVSSSVNDTAAGTGARTITVEGLLATYVPFTETVTLNGATPVALTNTTAIAINRVTVATVGSGGVNAGTIDVRVITGPVIKSEITVGATLGAGVSADFLYTIPASKVGLIKDIHFSATGVTGDLTVYLNSIDVNGVTLNLGAGKTSLYVTGFNAAVGKIHFGDGLLIPEKTLLELRAIVSAGAGDLVAQADLYIIDRTLSGW